MDILGTLRDIETLLKNARLEMGCDRCVDYTIDKAGANIRMTQKVDHVDDEVLKNAHENKYIYLGNKYTLLSGRVSSVVNIYLAPEKTLTIKYHMLYRPEIRTIIPRILIKLDGVEYLSINIMYSFPGNLNLIHANKSFMYFVQSNKWININDNKVRAKYANMPALSADSIASHYGGDLKNEIEHSIGPYTLKWAMKAGPYVILIKHGNENVFAVDRSMNVFYFMFGKKVEQRGKKFNISQ